MGKGQNQIVLGWRGIGYWISVFIKETRDAFLKEQLSNARVCVVSVNQLFFFFARSSSIDRSCAVMMGGAGWALVNLQFTISPLKHTSSLQSLFI